MKLSPIPLVLTSLLAVPGLAQEVLVPATQPVGPAGLPHGASFGADLALHGDVLLVGAPHDWGRGSDPGRVFVYERSAGAWSESGELVPSDPRPDDRFGWALDLDGEVAVVTAPEHPDGGRAYVFERTGGSWSQVAILHPVDAIPDDTYGDDFGWSVALSGDRIVVGDPRGDGNQADVGAVFVYERGSQGWGHVQTLHAPVATPLHRFGHRVALDGDTAAVAEPGVNSWSNGPIHVLRGAGGSLALEATLTAQPHPDGAALNGFPLSLALRGDRLVAGGWYDSIGVGGGAFVFERQGSAWAQMATPISALCGPSDCYGGAGFSVALEGDRIVSGKPSVESIAAWILEPDGSWSERRNYLAQVDTSFGWGSGRSVEIEGTTVVAGAPFWGTDTFARSGAIFFLDLPESTGFTGDSFCHGDLEADLCPCGLDTVFPQGGGCQTNSAWSGRSGLLIGHGSNSVSTGDFQVSTFGLPAGTFAILLRSPASSGPVPFGNGLRCITGKIKRGEVLQTDDVGRVDWGPGSKAFQGILPGDDAYFQVWFRDKSMCGHGFNMSNAFAVTFVP